MDEPEQAWHEAGHAVVATLLGGEVVCVTLESDLDGHDGHAEVHWRLAGGELAWAQLRVALAGPLAELDYRGQDVDQPAEVLAAWRGDWEEAEALLAQLEPVEARREALLLRALTELRELIEDPAVTERIARVAETLDAHGTLDAELLAGCL